MILRGKGDFFLENDPKTDHDNKNCDSPSGTVSEKLRVFSFKCGTGFICIDFTWYRVTPNWLYVVPAGHRMYFPASLRVDCVCHELKPDALPEDVQRRLFRLQFSEQKAVAPDDILASLLNATESIPDCCPQSDMSSVNHYRRIADEFCNKIKETDLSQLTAITQMATLLNTCERTLRRACLDVFGVTPAVILRYHLTLMAVELLTDTESKIQEISRRLKFSDYSKCSRFLKGRMGMCPNEFRQKIREVIQNQSKTG